MRASNYTTGIILPTDTLTGEDADYFAGLEKRLSYEHGKAMPALSGESLKTTADKLASIAPFSETNQPTLVQTSFVRRMRLLIACGLVRGIIPTSTRNGSNQLTLDAVLKLPDGECAEKPKSKD